MVAAFLCGGSLILLSVEPGIPDSEFGVVTTISGTALSEGGACKNSNIEEIRAGYRDGWCSKYLQS